MKSSEKNFWHVAGVGAVGSVIAASFCRADCIAKLTSTRIPFVLRRSESDVSKHLQQGDNLERMLRDSAKALPQHERERDSSTDVRLILKNERQLATYQQSSLTVITDSNTYTCHPEAIDIEHLGNEPVSHLICCVKAYDTAKLLIRLKDRLDKNSIIILIHNGLGVLDEIRAHLPQLRIISGICTIGAYLEKPFTARAFLDGKIYLGATIGHFTSDEVGAICTTFQAAELPFEWEDHIETRMWEKFALNCSINLLTVLFNCKNGDLLLHSDLLKKMTHEVAQVISAHGNKMSAAELSLKVTNLLKSVGDNYSSMYKDVQHNKPTELHYLNEYLVELAQQKKIAAPVNVELLNQFYTRAKATCPRSHPFTKGAVHSPAYVLTD